MPDSSYDLLPYDSHAFAGTAPDRLATLGAVFGLETCDPTACRVLELGCAAGGNLLPHLCAHPASSGLGIDLSERQVALGQTDIAALGLTNARLEVADLASFVPEPGAWDYVVCHGVWSWVPADVRNAILGCIRTALAPQGVAVVSYNTHPGWRMQGVLRDAMVYLSAGEGDALCRSARAREIVEVLARGGRDSGPRSPYETMLHQAVLGLQSTGDSYVAHEYLEAENTPFYLHEFVDAARQQGLRYLADSALGSMLPELLDEGWRTRLAGWARDVVSVEQYLDFLSGRRFRMSLLVREDASVRRDLRSFRADGTFVSTLAEPVAVEGEPGTVAWSLGGPGPHPTTRDPAIEMLMKGARAVWPRAAPYADLRRAAGSDPGDLDERLGHWLLHGHATGVLSLHRHDFGGCAVAGERPVAFPWARREATRTSYVTTQRHEGVALDAFDLFVLGRCDGRPREALVREVGAVLRSNDLGGGGNDSGGRVDAAQAVVEALQRLSDHGLMVS